MKDRRHSTVLALGVLGAACLICLGPFLNKAFHIDDTLFVWAARHVRSHPFDFYGFTANWNGTVASMSDIQKNPPLASYYIALASYLLGWSERAIHTAFLLPALAAVMGTYYLAKEFGVRPLEAALVGLLTPVFCVSGSLVMCDMLMLSLWVWAVFFWVRGLKEDNPFSLAGAALLIAACSLTKYYGMALLPLLLVYSLVKKRRAGHWALFLLIPVFILAGYEYLTHELYGRGLVLEAVSYASGKRSFNHTHDLTRVFTGLAFTGGCLLTTLFYAPGVWGRKIAVWGVLFTGVVVCGLVFLHILKALPLYKAHGGNWAFAVQFGLFVVAGTNVLALAVADLREKKDAERLLLFLWVFGTFLFGTFLNWSVNGRSFLPMAPAAGVLVSGRISRKGPSQGANGVNHVLPLVLALLLALWTNWSDYRFANAARSAALEVRQKYVNNKGTVWFLGHWGFQYYMEALGAKAVDFENSTLEKGDVVVLPLNSSNIYSLTSENSLGLIDELRYPSGLGSATMDSALGAGFYSDLWGPLPFAFGRPAEERYNIFLLLDKIQMPQAPGRGAAP